MGATDVKTRWYCVTCKREFVAPVGEAPTCFKCLEAGNEQNVVTRCHQCRKVITRTDGRACIPCATRLREEADRLRPTSQRMSASEFTKRWQQKWGPRHWTVEELARIETLCSEHESGPVKSAIRSGRSLEGIERYVLDVANGRNPGGSLTGTADSWRSKTGSSPPADTETHKRIGRTMSHEDDV